MCLLKNDPISLKYILDGHTELNYLLGQILLIDIEIEHKYPIR